MMLTESQERTMYEVRFYCCLVSIVGALFVIVVYFSMPHLRRLFAFRLIMYLSSSDLLFSAAMLLGPLKEESQLCSVQAVWITLFGLSTVLWTVCIALTMHLVVMSRSRNVEEHEIKMVLVCYGLPVVVAGLPFLTHSYGTSIEWCWFNNHFDGEVWQIVAFYGPLWAAFAINTYFYYEIRQYLGQVLDDLVGITEEEREEKRKVVSRLQLYPWVLLLCWVVGTVDCIYTYIYPDDPLFALSLLHYSLGSLQGAGNALVYGCNASVTGQLKQLCCHQEEPLLNSS